MPHYEGPETPRGIDLFAGAGGFTAGLLSAGINITHAFEKHPMAQLTYRVRHSEANNISIHSDATDLESVRFPHPIDIIVGGPPCQDFSFNGNGPDEDSNRNKLPFVMIEWAKKLDPKVVIIENVEGMKTTDGDVLSALLDEFDTIGYTTEVIKLRAADYGVPQDRERVFVIAVRSDIPTPDVWEPPAPCSEGQERLTQINRGQQQTYQTSGEVLESLPEPLSPTRPQEDPVHTYLSDYGAAESNRYTNNRVDPRSHATPITRDGEEVWIPPNHVAADHSYSTRENMAQRELGRRSQPTTSRRLDPEKVAPTITVSNGTKPIHYRGHSPSTPEEPIEDVRRLTVREIARLQGFMDEYVFAGTAREQTQQVANAVPPGVAWHLGQHIKNTVLKVQNTPERDETRKPTRATS